MASLTFPSSPSNGDTYSYEGLTYVYDSTKNKWSVQSTTTITDVQADSISASLTPSANVTYDLGTSEKSFRDLYLSGSSIYLGSQQISSNSTGVILPEGSLVGTSEIGSGSGVTVYANASILPTSGLTSGQMAYTGNAIFITNGSGWYRVAVTNQNPSLSITQDSISFTGNTGAVLDFNYTVSDPDGTTPTVTLSNSGFANTSVATIEHFTANNTVRITNFANTTYTGSITLTASDGISTGFDSANAIFTATVTITLASEWANTVLSVGTSDTSALDNSTYADRSGNISTTEYSSFGTGDIQNSEHPYLDNWSVKFPGTSGALYTADSTDFAYGTGDLTVEVWFYPTAAPANQVILDQRESSPSGGGYSIECGSNLIPYLATSVVVLSGTIAMNLNEWNHIVYTRSGTDLSLFVNGSRSATATNSTNFTSQRLTIGGYTNRSSSLAYGYITNVRLVKGTSVYDPTSTTITVPTESLTAITNTVLLTCQSNRFIDNSSSGHSISLSGAPEISAFNPFGQGSEYSANNSVGSVQFDTSSGVALYVAGSSLSNVWTIECWYKFDHSSTIDANHYLFDSRNGGAMYLYRSSTTTYSSPSQTWALTDDNFNDGAWHHFAWACDGTNTTMWLDGSRVQTVVATTTIGTFLWINSRQTNQYHNDCKFADLRVSSTARYASTATSITVPTAAVGYDGNTTAYYPFDNAGIYDKTGNHSLTLAGDVTTSTTQTKFANTSMYFDGSGDYITTQLLVGQGDFTAEGWVYFSNLSSNRSLFSLNNNRQFYYRSASNRIAVYGVSGGTQVFSDIVPSATTWTHFAFVRSGSTITLYLDGSSAGTATATDDLSGLMTIGGYAGGGTDPMFGYIENLQVLDFVKYTGTFTPPTAEQGRTYQATS